MSVNNVIQESEPAYKLVEVKELPENIAKQLPNYMPSLPKETTVKQIPKNNGNNAPFLPQIPTGIYGANNQPINYIDNDNDFISIPNPTDDGVYLIDTKSTYIELKESRTEDGTHYYNTTSGEYTFVSCSNIQVDGQWYNTTDYTPTISVITDESYIFNSTTLANEFLDTTENITAIYINGYFGASGFFGNGSIGFTPRLTNYTIPNSWYYEVMPYLNDTIISSPNWYSTFNLIEDDTYIILQYNITNISYNYTVGIKYQKAGHVFHQHDAFSLDTNGTLIYGYLVNSNISDFNSTVENKAIRLYNDDFESYMNFEDLGNVTIIAYDQNFVTNTTIDYVAFELREIDPTYGATTVTTDVCGTRTGAGTPIIVTTYNYIEDSFDPELHIATSSKSWLNWNTGITSQIVTSSSSITFTGNTASQNFRFYLVADYDSDDPNHSTTGTVLGSTYWNAATNGYIDSVSYATSHAYDVETLTDTWGTAKGSNVYCKFRLQANGINQYFGFDDNTATLQFTYAIITTPYASVQTQPASPQYAGKQFTFITDHTDSGGTSYVDYCYASLGSSAGELAWYVRGDSYDELTITAGSGYLISVSTVYPTSITNGWRYTWTVRLDWDFPHDDLSNVDSHARSINVGAADTGWQTANTNMDFENDLEIVSVTYTINGANEYGGINGQLDDGDWFKGGVIIFASGIVEYEGSSQTFSTAYDSGVDIQLMYDTTGDDVLDNLGDTYADTLILDGAFTTGGFSNTGTSGLDTIAYFDVQIDDIPTNGSDVTASSIEVTTKRDNQVPTFSSWTHDPDADSGGDGYTPNTGYEDDLSCQGDFAGGEDGSGSGMQTYYVRSLQHGTFSSSSSPDNIIFSLVLGTNDVNYQLLDNVGNTNTAADTGEDVIAGTFAPTGFDVDISTDVGTITTGWTQASPCYIYMNPASDITSGTLYYNSGETANLIITNDNSGSWGGGGEWKTVFIWSSTITDTSSPYTQSYAINGQSTTTLYVDIVNNCGIRQRLTITTTPDITAPTYTSSVYTPDTSSYSEYQPYYLDPDYYEDDATGSFTSGVFSDGGAGCVLFSSRSHLGSYGSYSATPSHTLIINSWNDIYVKGIDRVGNVGTETDSGKNVYYGITTPSNFDFDLATGGLGLWTDYSWIDNNADGVADVDELTSGTLYFDSSRTDTFSIRIDDADTEDWGSGGAWGFHYADWNSGGDDFDDTAPYVSSDYQINSGYSDSITIQVVNRCGRMQSFTLTLTEDNTNPTLNVTWNFSVNDYFPKSGSHWFFDNIDITVQDTGAGAGYYGRRIWTGSSYNSEWSIWYTKGIKTLQTTNDLYVYATSNCQSSGTYNIADQYTSNIYYINIFTYDIVGNVAASNIYIRLDRTAPTYSSFSMDADGDSGADGYIPFNDGVSNYYDDDGTFQGDFSGAGDGGGSGISYYYIRVNGGTYGSVDVDGLDVQCSTSTQDTLLNIEYKIQDAVGNIVEGSTTMYVLYGITAPSNFDFDIDDGGTGIPTAQYTWIDINNDGIADIDEIPSGTLYYGTTSDTFRLEVDATDTEDWESGGAWFVVFSSGFNQGTDLTDYTSPYLSNNYQIAGYSTTSLTIKVVNKCGIVTTLTLTTTKDNTGVSNAGTNFNYASNGWFQYSGGHWLFDNIDVAHRDTGSGLYRSSVKIFGGGDSSEYFFQTWQYGIKTQQYYNDLTVYATDDCLITGTYLTDVYTINTMYVVIYGYDMVGNDGGVLNYCRLDRVNPTYSSFTLDNDLDSGSDGFDPYFTATLKYDDDGTFTGDFSGAGDVGSGIAYYYIRVESGSYGTGDIDGVGVSCSTASTHTQLLIQYKIEDAASNYIEGSTIYSIYYGSIDPSGFDFDIIDGGTGIFTDYSWCDPDGDEDYDIDNLLSGTTLYYDPSATDNLQVAVDEDGTANWQSGGSWKVWFEGWGGSGANEDDTAPYQSVIYQINGASDGNLLIKIVNKCGEVQTIEFITTSDDVITSGTVTWNFSPNEYFQYSGGHWFFNNIDIQGSDTQAGMDYIGIRIYNGVYQTGRTISTVYGSGYRSTITHNDQSCYATDTTLSTGTYLADQHTINTWYIDVYFRDKVSNFLQVQIYIRIDRINPVVSINTGTTAESSNYLYYPSGELYGYYSDNMGLATGHYFDIGITLVEVSGATGVYDNTTFGNDPSYDVGNSRFRYEIDSGDGSYDTFTITYTAYDYAGNSDTCTFQFREDNVNPSYSITWNFNANDWFIKSGTDYGFVNIDIITEDAGSGLANVKFELYDPNTFSYYKEIAAHVGNGEKIYNDQTVYATTTLLSGGTYLADYYNTNGMFIRFYSTDECTNGANTLRYVRLDKTAPTGFTHSVENGIYYAKIHNSNPELTIVGGSDNGGSGIGTNGYGFYYINNENPPQYAYYYGTTNTHTFTLPSQSQDYDFAVTLIDVVGNVATWVYNAEHIYDTSNPSIDTIGGSEGSIYLYAPSTTTDYGYYSDNMGVTPTNFYVVGDVTDNYGLQEVIGSTTFSDSPTDVIGSGTASSYSLTYTIISSDSNPTNPDDEYYIVTVTLYDQAGNYVTDTYTFYEDNRIPEATVTWNFNANDWYIKTGTDYWFNNIDITHVQDIGSGLDICYLMNYGETPSGTIRVLVNPTGSNTDYSFLDQYWYATTTGESTGTDLNDEYALNTLRIYLEGRDECWNWFGVYQYVRLDKTAPTGYSIDMTDGIYYYNIVNDNTPHLTVSGATDNGGSGIRSTNAYYFAWRYNGGAWNYYYDNDGVVDNPTIPDSQDVDIAVLVIDTVGNEGAWLYTITDYTVDTENPAFTSFGGSESSVYLFAYSTSTDYGFYSDNMGSTPTDFHIVGSITDNYGLEEITGSTAFGESGYNALTGISDTFDFLYTISNADAGTGTKIVTITLYDQAGNYITDEYTFYEDNIVDTLTYTANYNSNDWFKKSGVDYYMDNIDINEAQDLGSGLREVAIYIYDGSTSYLKYLGIAMNGDITLKSYLDQVVYATNDLTSTGTYLADEYATDTMFIRVFIKDECNNVKYVSYPDYKYIRLDRTVPDIDITDEIESSEYLWAEYGTLYEGYYGQLMTSTVAYTIQGSGSDNGGSGLVSVVDDTTFGNNPLNTGTEIAWIFVYQIDSADSGNVLVTYTITDVVGNQNTVQYMFYDDDTAPNACSVSVNRMFYNYLDDITVSISTTDSGSGIRITNAYEWWINVDRLHGTNWTSVNSYTWQIPDTDGYLGLYGTVYDNVGNYVNATTAYVVILWIEFIDTPQPEIEAPDWDDFYDDNDVYTRNVDEIIVQPRNEVSTVEKPQLVIENLTIMVFSTNNITSNDTPMMLRDNLIFVEYYDEVIVDEACITEAYTPKSTSYSYKYETIIIEIRGKKNDTQIVTLRRFIIINRFKYYSCCYDVSKSFIFTIDPSK